MLANGGSMVPVAHAKMTEQALLQPSDMSDNHTPASTAELTTDCHGNVISAAVNSTSHPFSTSNNAHQMAIQDDASFLAKSDNNCCDGLGGCSLDCNHCLTISLTADLMDMPLVIANDSVNLIPVFMSVNRLSIDFPPAFRPPIA